ncbi:MAG TPA: ABC transporter substrate-binding protein [Gammaproteobacteria bacterium]
MAAVRNDPHDLLRDGRPLSRRDLLRGTAAAVAASGAGGLLAACGGGEAPAGDAITFLAVVPPTSLTFAPELFADAAGYFADQGLAFSFQTTRGSAQAIQLVLAGSAPLTRIGQIEAVAHAANRGAPLMNVGTVIKESTIRFVSHASAPLREPRDFVGKTVGIPSEGGETETTLDLILAAEGIDPASVTRQVVGVGPGVFNLVEQGRVAGFGVSIDTAKILERQMSGVTVLDPADFIESGAQIYMTTASGVGQHGPLIAKYLRAIAAALDFIIADDGFDETLRIMRQKYSFDTLLDDAIAKDSLAEYVRIWTAEGPENVLHTAPDSWRRGYEELVRFGLAEPGKDPAAWFTNELVPA